MEEVVDHMEIDMRLLPESEEDVEDEVGDMVEDEMGDEMGDEVDNEVDNEDDDPSFVPVGGDEENDTSDGEERKNGKGRKRQREKPKEAPLLNLNPAGVREEFRKFVQESKTTRTTKKGKIFPSRIYLKKTERDAGRAHTKVVLTPIGAKIRCHSTDVFRLEGDEIILDTATYPSDSTKDSINIGLRMMSDLTTGGGYYLQQKNFSYLLMRGFYDSNGHYQSVHVATVGNKNDGGAYLRMDVRTGKVLQITENRREIMPYAQRHAQRMVVNFIACHRFHRWECGDLAIIPREIVDIIARKLFVLLKDER
jgi:hypothetical protein